MRSSSRRSSRRVGLALLAGLAPLTALAPAAPAAAQTEAALKQAFEGQTVVVRIDMPASADGVDVYPQRANPVDYAQLGARLKEHGTALHNGQAVLVTKVRVKSNLIEFQLGGGGYGTFADNAGAPGLPPAPYLDTSPRERDIEIQLRYERDPWRRGELYRELDYLRQERMRYNATVGVQAAEAARIADEQIRQRKAEGGSRFNLRWAKGKVPPEALTPAGFRDLLDRYVAFEEDETGTGAAGGDPLAGLAKGMTVAQAEAVLGPAAAVAAGQEGSIPVETRTYTKGGQKVTAKFASGVLIEFTAR
jgi:hypothetical protein